MTGIKMTLARCAIYKLSSIWLPQLPPLSSIAARFSCCFRNARGRKLLRKLEMYTGPHNHCRDCHVCCCCSYFHFACTVGRAMAAGLCRWREHLTTNYKANEGNEWQI
ncbi:PREDICTED: uncharacterized protein LOC108383081 [Rhagoletis zephyria]|uniref:uncharacterized protein LOC108383081 n=1 Tax=Rhagoletis zephyria TaxID=28612 RepID=UPI0008114215|nr:PREDICTED: uncharacterized protein LOC108383081 [Rhagoletis zephyria]